MSGVTSSVFGTGYAGAYDSTYREKDYASECDVLEAAFHRVSGRKLRSVLDLGCGTGGHALELAKRGYEVTGVDRSTEMLRRAAGKVGSEGLPVRWHCADIRDFDLGQRFDAAISMFAVVGYVTSNPGLLGCFQSVRRHVSKGSPFVFDVWFGPAVLAIRPEPRRRAIDVDGQTIDRTVSTVIDLTAQCCRMVYSLSRAGEQSGERYCEEHEVRFFFPQEIRLLLEASAFECCSLTAFPSLEDPVTESSWNALVVARAV